MWEAQVEEPWAEACPGQALSEKYLKTKKGLRCSSSGRVPPRQACGLNFKLHHHQKKKKK
jgi:hypothetical protein